MKRHHVTSGVPFSLGRTGEHLAREIVFDLRRWKKLFGDGEAQLMARRSGENIMYAVPLDTKEDTVVWRVTREDNAIAGEDGECELRYLLPDGTFAKSETWAVSVQPSMNYEQSEPPETAKPWIDTLDEHIDDILNMKADIEETAERAAEIAARTESVAEEVRRAENARDNAGEHAEQAQNAASAAADSASAASNAANAAGEFAGSASSAAVEAANSATNAENSANQAAGSVNRIENMSVEAVTLTPGSDATVEKRSDGDALQLVFGLPASTNGKSAYEYAVEGGYAGTEEEFKKKLAAEVYSQSEADDKFLLSAGGNITGDLTAAGSVTANSFALDIGATLKVESAAILLEAPSGRPITIRPYANKANGVSFSSNYMFPETTDKLSLGKSTRKFKNLYLVGNITDGTNTVAVSDIAKKSDIPEIPESDDVIVTFTQTSDVMLSADKTYAEVLAAIQAGKNVVGKVVYASEGQNRIQYARNVLVDTANKRIVFSGLDEMTDRKVRLCEDNSVVDVESLHHNSHPTAHQDIRDELTAHVNDKENPHGMTAAQVGADESGAAAAALEAAKKYTDDEIAELINGAPTTLDTLGEIATAMADNADVVTALHEAVGSKAAAADLTALSETVAKKAEVTAVTALETAVGNKANAADLTAHTGNKNNPHGVTAAQIGTYTKGEIDTALSKKTDDFSLEINNNATGTGDVKFATIDYSTCDSNNGVSALIRMRSGHGNGKSFVFSQDAYIHVNYDGTVRVDNRKHYDSYVGKYDDVNHQYGDIFWVVDTDNKIVDFYCLVGQWSRLYMTPWARIANSSKGALTQHTTRILYSDGAKEWANNSVIVVKNDIPSWAMKSTKPSYTPSEIGLKTESWTFTLEDGSTVTKAVYVG